MFKRKIFVLILVFFFLSGTLVFGAIPASERAALIALYNATNGDSWTNNSGWKDGTLEADGFGPYGSEGNWYGVNLNGNSVQELLMISNNLVGTIPAELGNLLGLVNLHLHVNQLSGAIPPQLGNLSNLVWLYLNNNQLTGSIPPQLGNLNSLQYLVLFGNQLDGNIPTELGNLSELLEFCVQSNYLSGNIPDEIGNLTKLTIFWTPGNNLTGNIPETLTNLVNLVDTDIGYNGLHSSNSGLTTFLNSKDPDWADTQTIAPENLSASPIDGFSVNLTWDAIPYSGDSGGYRVYYSESSGGPYTFFGQTADKTILTMTVTGLNENTPYYFVIKTRTDTHGNNHNVVDSEYSAQVLATTPDVITITGTITSEGSPLEGAVINGLPGNPVTNVSGQYQAVVGPGWSGTAIPSLKGYKFTPGNTVYASVMADVITDYTADPYFKIESCPYPSGMSRHPNIVIPIDFNNDGYQDVIVPQQDEAPTPVAPVLAFSNNLSGIFSDSTVSVLGGAETIGVQAFVVADFNNDGRKDLFLADTGIDWEPFPGRQNLILIQQPDGTLVDESSTRLPALSDYTHDCSGGDIDGDGDIDIFANNMGSTDPDPIFLINDGTGHFTPTISRFAQVVSMFIASELVDIDKDGDLDLVLGSETYGERDVILLNDGNGYFTLAPESVLPIRHGGNDWGTSCISSADLNGDGWPDLIMNTHEKGASANYVQFMLNNRDDRFCQDFFRQH